MDLTKEIKEYIISGGADLVGIAPVNRYQQAPQGYRPGDILPGAKSVITFAYRLNSTVLEHMPERRNQYMVEFEAANAVLLKLVHQVGRFLDGRGIASIPIGPEASIGDLSRLKADFSHKHSAVQCGLGKFGVNNLLVTPKYGPGIRLGSVITAADLEYDQVLDENPCDQCQACAKICPSSALEGWEEKYHPEKGWVIFKEKCAHYMFTTCAAKRCGLCISACIKNFTTN